MLRGQWILMVLVGGCATVDTTGARQVWVPRGDAHHIKVKADRKVYVPKAPLNPEATAPDADVHRGDPPPRGSAGSR
jgi:hypothetical protein